MYLDVKSLFLNRYKHKILLFNNILAYMYFTETRGFLLLEEKQNYFNLKKNSFEKEE